MSLKQSFKKFKIKLREWRVSLAKQMLDREPPPSHIALTQARNILFLRQDGKIGDFVVSSFVFRAIKQQRPEAKIGVLCSRENAYLFENNPDIDHLHIVAERGVLPYYQMGKQLKNQYDVVIEPTLVFRVRELVLLRTIAAPYNLGYLKADYRIFNHHISDSQLHYSEIYCKLLNLIGIENVDTRYRLPEQPEAEQRIAEFLQQQQLTDYIALNFFGAARSRRFTPDSIRTILDTLTAEFPQQKWLLLGFPEVNAWLVDVVQAYSNCYLFENTKTIFDNIALIRHAKAVVSPDTSMVHIAVALDKPLIAIYNSDERNFANWYPYSQQAQILRYQQNINEINAAELIPMLAKIV